MNTRNISGMLLIIIIIIFIEGAQLAKAVFSGALILSYCPIVLQGKSQSGVRKLNRKQER